MGKTKYLSAFERCMVVGARRTGLIASIMPMQLGFSLNSFPYQEWSTTKRISSLINTTVGSIRVNMGQHPSGMLSIPCRVHAPANWSCSEGKGDATPDQEGVSNVLYTQCISHLNLKDWFASLILSLKQLFNGKKLWKDCYKACVSLYVFLWQGLQCVMFPIWYIFN
jgi:hypothetical protein